MSANYLQKRQNTVQRWLDLVGAAHQAHEESWGNSYVWSVYGLRDVWPMCGAWPVCVHHGLRLVWPGRSAVRMNRAAECIAVG